MRATAFAPSHHPDPARDRAPKAAELVAQGWLPHRDGADRIRIATSGPVTRDLEHRVADAFPGRELAFESVPQAELHNRQLESMSDELADHIANDFTRRHPEQAARTGFASWQRYGAVLATITLAALAITVPGLLFVLLVGFSTVITLTVATVSAVAVVGRRRSASGRAIALSDADLPTYTVLVPAYHEEAVIGGLVDCLRELDYPAEKLEVLLLVERRDAATKEAIAAAGPAAFMRVVELPPGSPQTKPRSCNAGLMLARGELLVVFDAEDRPEPDQLRKAATQFAAGGDDLGCVQAKLLVHNSRRNFITRQFGLEYSQRYELTLPGLARLKLPIPLGGTSNHFRTDVLRALGGWDAWNVTEDADLGMRCRARGYRVEVVDSVTWGESTDTVAAWTRQRTRWLKGFMLTALVYTRRPRRTLREFRPSGLITLLFIVGGTPALYLAQSVAFALWASHYGGLWNPVGHYGLLCFVMMVTGLFLSMGMAVIAAGRHGGSRASVFAPLLPLYWVMHWLAAWRALAQLIRAPFVWEKTPHGTTTATPAVPRRTALAPATA
jgi:cellulose synthase/poly-beta-1,6-N-acetylglucosamine synthase-like glycosyltransferase